MTLTEYLRENYRPATAKVYAFEIEHYLEQIGGEATAIKAAYGDLVSHLAYWRKRYDKPATVNRILCAVKSYYRYLMLTGKRPDHPGSRLTIRGLDRPEIQTQDLLTPEELALLLRPRPERYSMLAGRNAVVIGLLVHQGLRLREIGALRVQDVDLVAATVNVRASCRAAGRVLRLMAGQVMQLHDYITSGRLRLLHEPTDHLLLSGRGTPERGEGVHYLVETLRPLVPAKRLTPTVIRQSVIAARFKAGEDLRKVQAFAGHLVVNTTENYRNTRLEELRLAVERFHPLSATH